MNTKASNSQPQRSTVQQVIEQPFTVVVVANDALPGVSRAIT